MQSTIARVLTVLAVAGAGSSSAYAQGPPSALKVCLMLSPALGIGAPLEAAILGDVNAIWKPYGVTVGAVDDNRDGCDRLIAVRSSTEIASDAEATQTALAWVSFVEGRAGRVVFLGLSRARALVRSLSPGTRADGWTDQFVARLAGRSLAHELGHVLLDFAGHTSSGLMRARYRASDLLRDPPSAYTLDEAQRERLHAHAGEQERLVGHGRVTPAAKR